jgi:hypothetical protein
MHAHGSRFGSADTPSSCFILKGHTAPPCDQTDGSRLHELPSDGTNNKSNWTLNFFLYFTAWQVPNASSFCFDFFYPCASTVLLRLHLKFTFLFTPQILFSVNMLLVKYIYFWLIFQMLDNLCGLVAWVPGYRSRGLGSFPGTTRFSEKYWAWNGVHSASWVQLRSYLEEKVAASD